MKIDAFLSTVLSDINNGLMTAKQTTDRNYKIGPDNGVHFDIAVTTSPTGIEVIQAHIGDEEKDETTAVSRVKFSVTVPSKTNKELKEAQNTNPLGFEI